MNAKARIIVFVATQGPPGEDARATLSSLGINASPGRTLLTADLSARDIDALSEKPWIRSLRLSQKLRMT